MEQIAHAPEQGTSGFDLLPFALEQDADAYEFRQVRHAPAGARRPMREVQIAQTADAILDVRLQQVDRAAEALGSLVRLDFKAIQKLFNIADAEDALESAGQHLLRTGAIAGQDAPVEQGRGGGQIVLRQVEQITAHHTWCPMLNPASQSGYKSASATARTFSGLLAEISRNPNRCDTRARSYRSCRPPRARRSAKYRP